MSDEPLALGVDLGGSHLRIGVVSINGELRYFHRERITPVMTGDQLVNLIINNARSCGLLPEIQSVGIALAGAILTGGVLKREYLTLPGLGDLALQNQISEHLEKPCFIGNDSNLALLGEARFGAARGIRNTLLLTLGTNIGGGLLLDGRLWEGAHASGVEIGLSMLGDPVRGSVYQIEKEYSPGAIMALLGKPNGQLFDLIKSGNNQAKQKADDMFKALGFLITNIHLLLDLELVLLSGGIAEAGEIVRDGVWKAFLATCPDDYQFKLSIQMGSLPINTAGVIGAACLCFEQMEINKHFFVRSNH